MVKVELAGVSVEDVHIKVHGNVLFIAGSRRDKSCGYGGSYQQMEITYSSFEKTLKFPTSIENVTLEHVFDNGLLIIRLKSGEAVI